MGGRVCRATVMEPEEERGRQNAGAGQLLIIPVSSRAVAKWLSGVGVGWGRRELFPTVVKTGLATGSGGSPESFAAGPSGGIHLVGGYHPIPPALRFGVSLA